MKELIVNIKNNLYKRYINYFLINTIIIKVPNYFYYKLIAIITSFIIPITEIEITLIGKYKITSQRDLIGKLKQPMMKSSIKSVQAFRSCLGVSRTGEG